MSRPAEIVRRQCANPHCRKWFDVPMRLVRAGRGRYCHRRCGWNSQAKFKWFVCLQCGREFRREKRIYRKRKPRFCCAACYQRHRKGIKIAEDWRTFPLDP